MQAYGNKGVHAHAFYSDRLVADPSVFVATLRIVLLTLELQPRSSLSKPKKSNIQRIIISHIHTYAYTCKHIYIYICIHVTIRASFSPEVPITECESILA